MSQTSSPPHTSPDSPALPTPDANLTSSQVRSIELAKSGQRGGPRRATVGERVSAGVLASGALSVLVTAAVLTPSPTGEGTHTQLGLPACTWLSLFGTPCPTCGMTTSFSYAAEGDYLGSFLAQPAGFVLVLVTAMTVWIAGHVLVCGSTIGRAMTRLLSSWLLWAGLGLLLASWVYKIVVHEG